MNIVFLASEGVPFSKTGGLADVAGALPKAVAALGHQASLFLPCYRRVWEARSDLAATGLTLRVPVGAAEVEAHVYEGRLPGSTVPVYLIDQPRYFDRDGLYQHEGKDFGDNCERFVFFQRAVLEAIQALGIRPDVLHCNDWQTGLVPAYLRTLYAGRPELAAAGTVLTIHNLAYQGLFWHWDMPMTGLGWDLYHHRALEFHGHLSFMKAGLVFADKLSTVSPTYAREIQTPGQGAGLDGLLRERSGDLTGIVNGIDLKTWTPEHESMLAARYDAATVERGKAVNKAWLQERAGLPVRPEAPLFAQIGRLDPQKGWDLLAATAERLLERDVQLIVLGSGHPKYHALLEDLAARHPTKVWAYLGFSDDLAHQIEAGADVFLMPSLFEPCGLNQLYSLAHGTVPVVHATGGLVDTVVDLNPETYADGRATGFVFSEPTADALWSALCRALSAWEEPETWRRLIQRGMASDWSWTRSARQYVQIYDDVVQRRRPDLASAPSPSPASGRAALV